MKQCSKKSGIKWKKKKNFLEYTYNPGTVEWKYETKEIIITLYFYLKLLKNINNFFFEKHLIDVKKEKIISIESFSYDRVVASFEKIKFYNLQNMGYFFSKPLKSFVSNYKQ